MIDTADNLLQPADELRRWIFKALGPLGRPYAARRELRVALLGTLAVALAFAGTVAFPLWMLALSPIVLGVPHLLADFRYLVVRPGLHRRWAFGLVVVPLVAVVLVPSVAVGLLAVLGALLGARAVGRRRIFGLLGWAAASLAALEWSSLATFALAHGHNLLALALWWRWRRRTGRLHWLVPLLFAAGSAALLSGAVGAPLSPGLARSLGLGSFFEVVAPCGKATITTALILWFAFAQSIHYGVWLRLVPDEDRPRPAPRTFRASYRALLVDFGAVPLALAALAALGLAGWALHSLAAAREGYLGLAVFHGYLELAAATWLWAEAAPLRSAS